MKFRVKPFVEIASSMLSHMRAAQRVITDFSIGAVNRVMLEAPAAEIDELYQSYARGLIESIPIAIYRSFDFELQPAVSASGLVRFTARPTRNDPAVIPIGFIVANGGVQYQVAAQVVIPVGQNTADVLVVCTKPGLVGNAPSNAIVTMVSSALDLIGVTNPASFVNGKGMETEEERKLRFNQFIRALARGTPESCKYAARLAQLEDANGLVTERVTRAELDETPGHVDMWIHNGAGNTSDALLARAAELVHGGWPDPETGIVMDGYDPTGMRLDVMKMREVPIEAQLYVETPPAQRTDALKLEIIAAASGAIRATRSGGVLLPLDVVNAVLALRGSVLGVQVGSPLMVTSCPIDAVLVPGFISVDWV